MISQVMLPTVATFRLLALLVLSNLLSPEISALFLNLSLLMHITPVIFVKHARQYGKCILSCEAWGSGCAYVSLAIRTAQNPVAQLKIGINQIYTNGLQTTDYRKSIKTHCGCHPGPPLLSDKGPSSKPWARDTEQKLKTATSITILYREEIPFFI